MIRKKFNYNVPGGFWFHLPAVCPCIAITTIAVTGNQKLKIRI